MNRFAISAVLFVSVALSSCADVPATKKAQDSLQGDWQLVSSIAEGEPISKKNFEKVKITISGDTFTSNMGNGEKVETMTFILDPKAMPATIDLTVEGPRNIKGIWKLEKDTLTLCLPLIGKGEVRPKDFTPAKSNGVMVLERVKK